MGEMGVVAFESFLSLDDRGIKSRFPHPAFYRLPSKAQNENACAKNNQEFGFGEALDHGKRNYKKCRMMTPCILKKIRYKKDYRLDRRRAKNQGIIIAMSGTTVPTSGTVIVEDRTSEIDDSP